MGPYFCIIKKNLYVLGQLKLHYFFQFWVNEKHEHISVSSDAILAKMKLTFEWMKYTIAVKSYWKHICRIKMYFSSMNYNMKFRIYKTENVYWKDKSTIDFHLTVVLDIRIMDGLVHGRQFLLLPFLSQHLFVHVIGHELSRPVICLHITTKQSLLQIITSQNIQNYMNNKFTFHNI